MSESVLVWLQVDKSHCFQSLAIASAGIRGAAAVTDTDYRFQSGPTKGAPVTEPN